MMPEISLNILDVTQNSVSAGASLIQIDLLADKSCDLLTLNISDNGCGMTAEQVEQVTDPFFTSRSTRKVGLGIPFLKMAAELAGGSFCIKSQPGCGTCVTATFRLSDIDRMPLGDMAGTMTSLIATSPDVDFVLCIKQDDQGFTMDTRQFREILQEVPLSEPVVLSYSRNYICENMTCCCICI